MNDLLSIPNVVYNIFLIIDVYTARLLSPFGACEFRSVIRDENRDDAESALGAAAEPVILRDEAPDDAEAASGAGSEPDDDDEDERGMCSSES